MANRSLRVWKWRSQPASVAAASRQYVAGNESASGQSIESRHRDDRRNGRNDKRDRWFRPHWRRRRRRRRRWWRRSKQTTTPTKNPWTAERDSQRPGDRPELHPAIAGTALRQSESSRQFPAITLGGGNHQHRPSSRRSARPLLDHCHLWRANPASPDRGSGRFLRLRSGRPLPPACRRIHARLRFGPFPRPTRRNQNGTGSGRLASALRSAGTLHTAPSTTASS